MAKQSAVACRWSASCHDIQDFSGPWNFAPKPGQDIDQVCSGWKMPQPSCHAGLHQIADAKLAMWGNLEFDIDIAL
jgi:hypothetical protein